MALTEQQKQVINANLDKLNYAKGNGLLKVNKKRLLPNEGYLFISSGGTGYKALREIKKQIERTIEPNSLGKIAYLAVDCAHTELDKLVEECELKQDEIVKVPSDGALGTIDPKTIDEDKELWVDPRLYSQAQGGIQITSHPGFENNGAGAWRQPGRVRLTTTNGYTLLKRRIYDAANKLLPVTSIKVFFLCSVAGGTGSGTIIDLAYITRSVLNSPAFLAIGTKKFNGYIFSPDACEGEIDEKHNPHANHVAAMKEIDYLMRTGKRGVEEATVFRYGNEEIKIEADIFDCCVLVDGRTALAGFGNQAPQAAREAVAHTVLMSMTSGNIQGGVGAKNLVDSIYSNTPNDINGSLSHMIPQTYPRYRGYHFNVNGFASLVVPTELLTAVLAYNVFEMLWKKWQERPEEGAAEAFLKNCGIDKKHTIGIDQKTLKNNIEREATNVIKNKNKGLVYMIDLANDAITLLKGADYKGYAENRQNKRKSWRTTVRRIDGAIREITDLNNGAWEITRAIYTTFKKLLKDEAGILTDVKVFNNHFNQTLYFCPINLTNTIEEVDRCNALSEYIFSIYPEKERKRIADEFGDALFTKFNSAELVGIKMTDPADSAKFDPAKVIQDLIQEKFKKLIDDNIENFLVKFFAANAEATPTEPDPNNPANRIPTPALRQAATEIVNILVTRGSPMALLNDLEIKTMLPANRYITVPSKCPNLLAEITVQVQNLNAGVGVSTRVEVSEATDELTMVEVFQGLPSYVFSSIADHEADYEAQCDNPAGIHIVEAADFAHNWRNLANPAKTGFSAREADLRAKAKKDYDEAKGLGMVIADNTTPGFYKVLRIKSTRDVNATVDRLKTEEFDGYIATLSEKPLDALNIATCVQDLINLKIVEYRPLSHNLDANRYGQNQLTDDQYYDFAWNTLRQKFQLWNEVKVSIGYFSKLNTEIEKYKALRAAETRQQELFKTFVRALRACDSDANGELVPTFIRYDEGDEKWYIKPDTDESVLADVSDFTHDSTIPRECKEYFAFIEFAKLDDQVIESIRNKLTERNDDKVVRNADKQNGLAMSDALQAIRQSTKVNRPVLFYPMATVSFADEANKIEDGLAQRIREFYNELINVVTM